MTHICVSDLTTIGSDNGLSPGLNQCWNMINWNLRNNCQGNFNRNSYIFIQVNTFENVVWKMAAILSQPQCFNKMRSEPNGGHWVGDSFTCIDETISLSFDANYTEDSSSVSN